MAWKIVFERKTLEMLHAELNGEERLHRVLGPTSLTSLGVGAIIGAGIFAMTGRVAATDAGPAVVISFALAGIACVFAALCYAEFASLAPVAGSAYTYTYATLGEIWAWIIGWDLILEYAMSCAVVAAHWTHYLDEALRTIFGVYLPARWTDSPFQQLDIDGQIVQPYMNLPAVAIIAAVTCILVIGIRESAFTNTLMVLIKLAVVVFVIALGCNYINPANWTEIPVENRLPIDLPDYLARHPELEENLPPQAITSLTTGEQLLREHPEFAAHLSDAERTRIGQLPDAARRWGLLALLGVREWLTPIDDAVRSRFLPYGFSGLMVGAALVFFAYVGFDSISTHAEEAIRPQRDVPFAILASLILCTVLYMAVAAVITGMEPYPEIDTGAALAAAFRKRATMTRNPLLNAAAGLIAAGALAGMTSVILVTFLSQARIFLAMARDGLLPRSIFAAIHPRYKTPHRSTILTGCLMAIVAGFFPIRLLEEMVSIGTLMAFVLVCGSVLLLRMQYPHVERPFRCPCLYFVAPAGIVVNLSLMLFLPLDTWLRLVIWLAVGILFYFSYGIRHSILRPRAPT